MIDKTYDAKHIEAHWRARWETLMPSRPSDEAEEAYCIMLPPPNVTGSLHMGHGFQVTLMDALVRYQRMCGKKVLWQGGTDHAGIATQMVVERQLLAQGKTKHELGRERFISAIWDWKATSGHRISQQLRHLGASIDWSRERFTYDADFSAAVTKVFVDLYDQGLIYRGKRLVNWDPQLLTAVSDLEVISQEEQGFLWTLRYPLADDSKQFILVATTRPETLLGDMAIAVHPADERFQVLIGKQVRVPLTSRTVPIVADESVDPSFGSGCVKITPAHDFNDHALAQRHHLGSLNIFTETAHLNDEVPAAYRGLERFAARKRIIDDLTRAELLVKTEAHTLKIPRGDRSGAVIEPYLTDQWFVTMSPLAKPAITAITNTQLEFIPDTWRKVSLQWLENIEDWCISRQLWWGHRIPAWSDPQGKIYVGYNEKAVREKYAIDALIPLKQDEDVLDTWFSSALWPFVTLGWPNQERALSTFYPSNVLVTGFDIIFFWVARMLMLGLHFMGDIPFKQVYVTGLIRDHEGQKMSKSKGNVLDPMDVTQGISLEALLSKRCQGLMQNHLIEKIQQATRQQFPQGIPALGTDALRFTYCALAAPTRDIRFDLNRTEGYRNFCNKLWNAARFVIMHAGNNHTKPTNTAPTLPINQAFSSLLQTTVSNMHAHFKTYRFDLLAQTIYEFIWNEYCDWYLELAKPILLNTNQPEQRNETLSNLIHVLETCLRLLHPLMPFITEEIWQAIAPLTQKQANTLMLQPYPLADRTQQNAKAEQALTWIKRVVTALRTLRSEMGILPSKKLTLFLNKGTSQDREHSLRFSADLQQLAKLKNIQWIDNCTESLGPTALTLVGTLELLIPMRNLIDTPAELCRLEKEIGKLDKEIQRAQAKLNNVAFLSHAPAAVVTQEQERLTHFTAQQEKLRQQHARLHAFNS